MQHGHLLFLSYLLLFLGGELREAHQEFIKDLRVKHFQDEQVVAYSAGNGLVNLIEIVLMARLEGCDLGADLLKVLFCICFNLRDEHVRRLQDAFRQLVAGSFENVEALQLIQPSYESLTRLEDELEGVFNLLTEFKLALLEFVADFLLRKRARHVFEAVQVQLISGHGVVLELNSKDVDNENELGVRVEGVDAGPGRLFVLTVRVRHHELGVVEELLEEGVEADFFELFLNLFHLQPHGFAGLADALDKDGGVVRLPDPDSLVLGV
eukprot:CAMPEP_0170479722 /NCGR_PEP_ID=MMETSP0208-20121228/846_1 /TAXON_ID=197538 /ORGANISM="Strombidium inclinatum, Strain S3" /LENGTH=266 /DNA_ID=CAMNT_0010752169 /DNA_START=2580 /DNA_END=3380 /DNA_ORIENTATION=-